MPKKSKYENKKTGEYKPGKTIAKTKDPPKSHERINSHLFCAETGMGKTYTAREILHDQLSHVPEENRILVCPTFKFDKTLGSYFKNEDLIQDDMQPHIFIPALLQLIEKDRDEIYEKHHYKFDKEGNKVKIPRKPDTEPYREYVLMLDDCIEYLGAGKQSIKNITLLFTKNRHYLLHLVVCMQYYKSAHPCIRNNARQIYLWQTNLSEMNKICDEQNFINDKDEFKRYFAYITKPKYSYFHINNKKRGKNRYENDVSYKDYKTLRDYNELSDSESDDED